MENNNTVIIELDRPRELKLSHKVMKRFMAKHKLKMSTFDVAVDEYDKASDLIYEMLKEEDPTLTVEKCDDLLDAVSLMTIMQKVAEAIKAAFPEQDEDQEQGEEENPTGKK